MQNNKVISGDLFCWGLLWVDVHLLALVPGTLVLFELFIRPFTLIAFVTGDPAWAKLLMTTLVHLNSAEIHPITNLIYIISTLAPAGIIRLVFMLLIYPDICEIYLHTLCPCLSLLRLSFSRKLANHRSNRDFVLPIRSSLVMIACKIKQKRNYTPPLTLIRVIPGWFSSQVKSGFHTFIIAVNSKIG